ncbi:MAG: rhamnosyltransferase subunit B [Oceanicoccus sp.]|jgi:rhamnosyltransferase subunit B
MNGKEEIIMMVIGTSGDINPLLAIAIEFKTRGHPVVFLTNSHFQDTIEKNGIKFVSVGSKSDYERLHKDSRIWDRREDFLEIAFESTIKPAMDISFNFVVKRYKVNPDIIVIGLQPLMNGALIAAEVLPISSVIISLSPNGIPSYISPPAPLCWLFPEWMPNLIKKLILKSFEIPQKYILRERSHFQELNRMRVEYGVGPIKKISIDMFQKQDLHIGLFPEWFGMRPKDWPTELKLVGFPLSDRVSKRARLVVDDFVKEHGSPVLFTTGTGVHDVGEFFSQSQKICETLGVPGIFIGGTEGLDKNSWPAKYLHLDYVDFEHALPQCKAIVHHGGIGTLAQAVRAGIPQLIRPLTFDQPDNGTRLYRLGLGCFVLPEKYEKDLVVSLLNAMINSTPSNRMLASCAADLKRNNSINKACDLIEQKLFTSRDNSQE